MTTQYMQDLPKGATFIGPDGATHKVTLPASEHPSGWVVVWNLSMPDDEVLRLMNTPGAVEEGSDPREGFFAYSHPVAVEVIS